MSSSLTAQRGFSLIELVTVIVLLGIVLVTVAPRFSTKQTFAHFAVRDQLISSFRYAQQRAMSDHGGDCYRLLIDANGFGAQSNRGGAFNYIDPDEPILFSGDYAQISVTQSVIYFDGLGNALTGSCSTGALSSSITVAVSSPGLAPATIEIFPTGYLRAI